MAGGPEEGRRLAELDARFDAAVGRTTDGAEQVTLLYSGGVDSTIVALALRGRVRLDAIAVGTRGSADLARARSAGDAIGVPVRTVIVDEATVRGAFEDLWSTAPTIREPSRSVQTSLAVAVAQATTPRVLAGQGADELFGGYAHFRGLSEEELDLRRIADLQRLLEQDWPLSRRIAAGLGHDLRSPFLEAGFLEYARALPMEKVGPRALTKPLLRRWAVHRGVPAPIAREPKHAMQYGSGIARVVQRLVLRAQ